MKATGIVRRIDDLGRVVIPKEIRRTMRIREGDSLEIFTANDGEVIFKKYSPLDTAMQFVNQYADVLYKASSTGVVICDKDNVVAVAGLPKKELADRRISAQMENFMQKRKATTFDSASDKMYPIENIDKHAICVAPVVVESDAVGAIALLANDNNQKADGELSRLCEMTAMLMAKQMES